MTIHQAKGREWNRVGVILNDVEIERLNSGLQRSNEDDRQLYVAITRARCQVHWVREEGDI
jgi:DNA helicase II / ATP-dependent DNA helicase PcrA